MAKKCCTLMQNLGGRDGTAAHCGVVIEEGRFKYLDPETGGKHQTKC